MLAHEGGQLGNTGKLTSDSPIVKVINKINHINACLSGHSHKTYVDEVEDKDGNNVITGQAGKYGTDLLRTRIFFDSDKDNFKIDMNVDAINTNLSYDQLKNKDDELLKEVNAEYNTQYDSVKDKLNKVYFHIKEQPGMTPEKDSSLGFEPKEGQI
ncbi:MAG: hypothetical protein K2M43_01150 [Mycoplasmoidaceae bacterium]|nr:hypothetical protein [Mycoplasmoidaceae bacterium]